MKKPVAIPAARDPVPARLLLLFVVVGAFLLAIAAKAHAETRPRPDKAAASSQTRVDPKAKSPAGQPPAVQLVTAKEPVRGSLADQAAVTDDVVGTVLYSPAAASAEGRLPAELGRTIGVAPASAPGTKMTPPDRSRGSAQRGTYRAWYPEAHNYLRPYRYRWRYWTPG